ncbi:hypothetical protein VME_45810 [Vibrio harveyi 1DA3]|nr:hypothetical protein VME_45810 [Vibrio harveyi 1DA3]
MDLYVRSTIKGCYIKNSLGDVIAKLEYMLQPIASTKLLTINSFECLSKIEMKDLSLSPEDFFQSSKPDLIKKICLSQIKYFNEFDCPDTTMISYNIPVSALADRLFVRKVIRNKVKKVALEITSFDIQDPTAKVLLDIIENVDLLRGNGIEIWFDDFNHENEQHVIWLCILNWDSVKVDKHYLNIEDDFKSMIECLDMLKKLKIPIIVEGVEDKFQYGFLLNEDVMIQGFIISKAKPCHYFSLFKSNFYLV